MAKLVSSASMIRILKQALHSKIEAYGLFVYIKIELCGSHRIAVLKKVRQSAKIQVELSGIHVSLLGRFATAVMAGPKNHFFLQVVGFTSQNLLIRGLKVGFSSMKSFAME